MSKVPEHLIEEARKRGIVPGAMIKSAANDNLPSQIVLPIDQWTMWNDCLNNGPLSGYLLNYRGKWATVVTPAPSQAEGLKEGDAVECGPAMRAAIIELAKELGVSRGDFHEDYPLVWFHGALCYTSSGWGSEHIKCKMPPEVFIAKMRVTGAQPKPIKIGDHTVKFNADGSVKVGCTTVDFATLEAVYNKAKQTKP